MRLNKEEEVDFKKLRISNFKSFVDPVEAVSYTHLTLPPKA